jgi:hypothetical protein
LRTDKGEITSLDEGAPALHALLTHELRDATDMAALDGSFLLSRELGLYSEGVIIQGGTESALSWIALTIILALIFPRPSRSPMDLVVKGHTATRIRAIMRSLIR